MDIIRRHFNTIDSTNTWAKQHAHEFSRAAVTLVTADGQTGGRGRFNRQWVSPPGQNIYASYCVFLEKHRSDIGNLPQVAAIAIARTVSALGLAPRIKWPNDMLLSNKKAAGILSESTPLSDMLCLIIGIGLNVNMPAEVLNTIDRPATSLLVESGHPYQVAEVLDSLTAHFLSCFSLFLDEGFHPFLEEYRQLLLAEADQTVRFHDNRAVWEGCVDSINSDGSLNLRLSDGTLRTFYAGEILP